MSSVGTNYDIAITGVSVPSDVENVEECNAYDYNSDEDLESLGSDDEDFSDYRDVQDALTEELTSLCDGLVLGLQPNAPRGRMRPNSRAVLASGSSNQCSGLLGSSSVPVLSLPGCNHCELPPMSSRSPRAQKRLVIGAVLRDVSPDAQSEIGDLRSVERPCEKTTVARTPRQSGALGASATEVPPPNALSKTRPPLPRGSSASQCASSSSGPCRAAARENLVHDVLPQPCESSAVTAIEIDSQDHCPSQQTPVRPREPDGSATLRRPLSCRRLSLRQH